MPPAVGGVAVGAHEGRAGLGEVFEVELVADAGAGPGVHAAEFGRHGAQEAVVVRVAEVHLERVVVHVAQGNIGLDPGMPKASNWSHAMVPVASWVRVWSMRRPISLPGVMVPETR